MKKREPKPGHITSLIMEKGYKIEPIGIGPDGGICHSFKLRVTRYGRMVKGSLDKTYSKKDYEKKIREIEKFLFDDIVNNGGKANDPQKPH